MTNSTEQHRILIVNNDNVAEMRMVVDVVKGLTTTGELEQVKNIPDALQFCSTKNWSPDLIILCQNWSHEFSEAEIHQLLTTLPLARLVCCYGYWCESDGRNYDLLPPGSRVQARLAKERIQYEWDVLKGIAVPVPLTARRDEIFHQQSKHELPEVTSHPTVSIFSPDRELKIYWQELLTTTGWNVLVPNTTSSRPQLLLYDLDPWSSALAKNVDALHEEHSDIPIVGMMNACRPEDYKEAISQGVTEILPKLIPAHLMLQQLIEILADSN